MYEIQKKKNLSTETRQTKPKEISVCVKVSLTLERYKTQMRTREEKQKTSDKEKASVWFDSFGFIFHRNSTRTNKYEIPKHIEYFL